MRGRVPPRQLGSHWVAARGLSPLDEILARALGKLALPKCVRAAVLGFADEIKTLGDLAVRVPKVRAKLVASRKRPDTRVFFEDWTGTRSRHVAGAGVQNRDLPERTRELDEVLGAESVRIERFVERRIEIDHAGDVDHHVDRSPKLLQQRAVDATERAAHVAVDGDHAIPKECLVVVPVKSSQRLE
jgi:hypothetical protein